MDKLQQARLEIDAVDREMAQLFVRRMRAVEAVADYKREHGLPVFDAAREDAVIAKNAVRVEDETIRPYYVEFLRDTMKASRHYQRKRLEGMKVAFSGIEGAFASIAAGRIFPDAERLPYPDFKSAYDAVVAGDADVAVLPIENSTAGEVAPVVDLMFAGSLYVTAIYDFSITHNLLGIPGAKLSDVKTVVSHPQALSQCAGFLRERNLPTIPAENTAIAAKSVMDNGDPTVAAIASEETAKLYGMEILARAINETGINTTRFAVVSRAAVKEKSHGKHTILLFTVRHEAGFLAKAINIIGEHGYNMRCLRSRPMKDLLWQYYFYVELEGDIDTPEGEAMLRELSDYCAKLKVLGCFRFPAALDSGE